MKLVWRETIIDVREKFLTVSGKRSADGKAELQVESQGWWITVEHFSIFAGKERPVFNSGDKVKITLEHEQEKSHAH